MKMNESDFALVKAYVSAWDTEARREQYRSGNYPRAERTQDVNKRYRWDLFWAVMDWSPFFKAEVRIIRDSDPTMTDEHFDTALRRIVPPL